ncbi:CBS domain-containing protein [Ollibium composti]|jgi:CBS domain-containing protein|uniref:CBS domain-containing protein n=1 Tax=Ollibium composti TaxID=2675109 RepID=A0ABY2Q555_9HYPH|nr:CBS domain-containing protein [Mesorhizobium composti]THF55474.1 CBS domain-containing protein [Mesorhizobium composti]
MRVKDLMKSNVVTVKPDNSVKHAAQIMLTRGIGGLPVVDDHDVLVGIITEGDLLGRSEIGAASHQSGKGSVEEWAAAFVKNHSWKVADVMTRGVIAVEEGASIGRVAALMNDYHVKRLPVTHDGRLVGIVSRVDLLHLIATAEPDDCAPGDTAIRRSILSRLGEMALDDFVKLSVIVSDGVVHLWGDLDSISEREAARVVSEGVHGVAGVAGVVDHTRVSLIKSDDKERHQSAAQ